MFFWSCSDQICFGLFAIRRSDTTNDAMFDPDFVALEYNLASSSIWSLCLSEEGKCFCATKPVQRAEGHEVQVPSRTIFAEGKKRRLTVVSLWPGRWDLIGWWRKQSANTTMGYLPLGIVLLSDWSVCARCGLVAPSWQYTATSGGMDPAPLSELMITVSLSANKVGEKYKVQRGACT